MGSRLWDKGKPIDREVLEFSVGNDYIIDQQIMPADIVASAAHAKMLCSIGILSNDETKDLVAALNEIYQEALNGEIEIELEMEDCHTAIESLLVKKCGQVGKKIHTGRSRNDQVLVALRLVLREQLLEFSQSCLELAEVFSIRAKETKDVIMPGYTHMQLAMPTSVGVWLQSYAEWLLDLSRDALALFETSNINPLGVASGFGVPLKLDRKFTTVLLGFDSTQRNPIWVQNSRGYFELKFLKLLSNFSLCFEKLASDFLLFTSSEYRMLKLPSELTTGSSIMPQKANPDIVELMRGSGSKLKACSWELESVISKLPSHYHRDYQLTKEPFLKANSIAESLFPIIAKLVQDFEINDDIMAQKSSNPELYVTYEVYRLVSEGSTFRDAYKKTAKSFEENTIDYEALKGMISNVVDSLEIEISRFEKELEKTIKDKVKKEKDISKVVDGIFK